MILDKIQLLKNWFFFILQIMEVPLLSQDDFFRHLNLRSVHATSAKYHYRQALKERLRASSQSASLSPPPSKKAKLETKSPILSPVKWLTPKTRKKLFGRPKIRSEGRRILDFDNNLIPSGKVEESGLLKSLLSNCHVLRHPGVRQEVEAKIQCGTSKHFQLEDEFWEPPNSCIQIRKTYIKKVNVTFMPRWLLRDCTLWNTRSFLRILSITSMSNFVFSVRFCSFVEISVLSNFQFCPIFNFVQF